MLKKKKNSKTYLYNNLLILDEMNTSGSKTPITFIPLNTNYDCKGIFYSGPILY